MPDRLADLRNLGPASEEQLRAVGIETPEHLDAIGSVEAFVRLKQTYGSAVTLVFLYALEGALLDVHWNELPPGVKTERVREAKARLQGGTGA